MPDSFKAIHTTNAPEAIGPYSQGVRVNGLVFLSGQIPFNPKSGELVKGSIEVEAKQVLENVKALVEASGRTMSDVVKTTIFLTDISQFTKVNEIYAQYFTKPYPARSTVEVKGLPRGVQIEIETIIKDS